MKNTENESQKRIKDNKISLINIILFPFKLLGIILSFVFNFIKLIMKIISIALLIFIIWFGYNFYTNFCELEERGLGRNQAAIEAFTTTFNKTKNSFNNIYEKIPPLPFSFFSNEYIDKENIRDIFIKTRGIPEAYIIIISYDEIKEGVPVKRDEPLWFEVWFYGEPYNKKVVFENGFFKKETKIDAIDDFIDNSVSPLFYTNNTTKNEMQSIFGVSDCIITEKAGNDTLTTYRFEEKATTPLTAITFINEKIIAVSSGIVFLGDNENSLCK